MIDAIVMALYTIVPALLIEIIILNLLMVLGLREGFGACVITSFGFVAVPAILFGWIWIMDYFTPGAAMMLLVWFMYLPLQLIASVLGLVLSIKLFSLCCEFWQNREKERFDHAQD